VTMAGQAVFYARIEGARLRRRSPVPPNAAPDLPSVGFVCSESIWRAGAFGLGPLGSLPPLVHLRRGAPGPT